MLAIEVTYSQGYVIASIGINTETMNDLFNKSSDTFRIVHTADWHLGKTLNDQSRDEEHAMFLHWLLGVIEEREVDALIIAGDVFDAANPPQSAQSQYYNFVSELYRNTTCSLIVIGGNHDSPAQLEAPREVLHALRVHVVGFMAEKPASCLIVLPSAENPSLVVAAIPFLRDRDIRTGHAGQDAEDIRRAITEGILRRYAETAEAADKWAKQGVPILVTGHLTVTGASDSDSEREIHIGGLGAVSADAFPDIFSYVALGHLHRPQKLDMRVGYSGSPIPLSFSEANDTKQIRILDFADGEMIAQASIPVPVFRRLAQIRTTWDGLPEAIGNFDPVTGELQTWVEVVIQDAGTGEDINETVQRLVENREFDVLKVMREVTISRVGMSVGSDSADEAIERILESPAQVFEHRLGEEPQFNEELKQELRIAFAWLLEQREGNGADV